MLHRKKNGETWYCQLEGKFKQKKLHFIVAYNLALNKYSLIFPSHLERVIALTQGTKHSEHHLRQMDLIQFRIEITRMGHSQEVIY